MKTIKRCLIGLSLSLLVFTLATTQVHAQQKESKPIAGTLQTETKVRQYYIDSEGKKKYVSQGKTQKMWTDILSKCPTCLAVAEEYNVNIYQNKKYIKKTKDTKDSD